MRHLGGRALPLEAFQPGDVVSFCDEHATVIVDWGTSLVVEILGTGRCTWYKVFQGEPVKLVERMGR